VVVHCENSMEEQSPLDQFKRMRSLSRIHHAEIPQSPGGLQDASLSSEVEGNSTSVQHRQTAVLRQKLEESVKENQDLTAEMRRAAEMGMNLLSENNTLKEELQLLKQQLSEYVTAFERKEKADVHWKQQLKESNDVAEALKTKILTTQQELKRSEAELRDALNEGQLMREKMQIMQAEMKHDSIIDEKDKVLAELERSFKKASDDATFSKDQLQMNRMESRFSKRKVLELEKKVSDLSEELEAANEKLSAVNLSYKVVSSQARVWEAEKAELQLELSNLSEELQNVCKQRDEDMRYLEATRSKMLALQVAIREQDELMEEKLVEDSPTAADEMVDSIQTSLRDTSIENLVDVEAVRFQLRQTEIRAINREEQEVGSRGLKAILDLSDSRLSDVQTQAKLWRSTWGDEHVVIRELADLLEENVSLRKTLNAYSLELLRGTIEKLDLFELERSKPQLPAKPRRFGLGRS
jgi:chromosome segregation ATPase